MSQLNFPEIVEPPAAAPASREGVTVLIDVAEIVNGTMLVKYSATEAGLVALKTNLAGKTYDLKTTKGNDAARADRKMCVDLRATLEKRRKAFKAPALEFGKKIDAEAARITAEIEALEKPIDDQIKADEARRAAEKAERDRMEAERIAKHQATIATVRAYLTRCQQPGMTAERIGKGIDALQAMAFGPEMDEFAVPAADAQCQTLEAMRKLHAQALGREQEAARQEAIRAENERVARELAEARARIDAEAAEVRRRAAEVEATEKRLRDEKLAREADEAARIARETREAADRQHAETMQVAQTITEKMPEAVQAGLINPGQADSIGALTASLTADAVISHAARPASQGITPRPEDQQVLKVTPETADATDRSDPATTSPGGGPTGAGQATAVAPAGVQPVDDQPTIPLGDIKRAIFGDPQILSEKFIESLGVKAHHDGRAVLYTRAGKAQFILAFIQRLQGLL